MRQHIVATTVALSLLICAPTYARADHEGRALGNVVFGGGLGVMALLSGLTSTIQIVMLSTRPPYGQFRPQRAVNALLALGYTSGGFSLAIGSIALGVGIQGHGRGWAALGAINMGLGLASIIATAICQARCQREITVGPLLDPVSRRGGLSVAWRF